MSPTKWVLLLVIAAASVLLLSWSTRKRKLFTQFLVLLSMGVLISFLLLAMVQLPEGRPWLETLLVVTVFAASPIAVRLFLQGLRFDDEEPPEEAQD